MRFSSKSLANLVIPATLAALLSPVGDGLMAQSDGPASRQAACEAAARQLEQRVVSLRQAQSGMLGCKQESADLLPQRWREATPDTADLMALIRLSITVRDRRIYAEVRAIALATEKPAAVRGAAVAVLGGYSNPTLIGRAKQDRQGVIEVMIGERTHEYQVEGLQSLGPAEYAEIDRVLRVLAAEKRVANDVPYLAEYVLKSVALACAVPSRRASIPRCP